MCIWLRVRMCMCMSIHVCVCVCVCVCVRVFLWLCVCVHVRVSDFLCSCVCFRVCAFVCVSLTLSLSLSISLSLSLSLSAQGTVDVLEVLSGMQVEILKSHTATHCNTMQHGTATWHCNMALQHGTATEHCKTMAHLFVEIHKSQLAAKFAMDICIEQISVNLHQSGMIFYQSFSLVRSLLDLLWKWP